MSVFHLCEKEHNPVCEQLNVYKYRKCVQIKLQEDS
jgi:hypothetical protein